MIDSLMTWARQQAPFDGTIISATYPNEPVHRGLRRVRLEISAELTTKPGGTKPVQRIMFRVYLAEPRCYHGINKVDARFLIPCECGQIAEMRIGC
jgi:hypothetical protein